MRRCPSKGSVQFSHSVVSDSLQPHGLQHARLPCPSPASGDKLMSIASVMPSNHLILCHPLLLPPSVFPSIRVFPNESALCIRWPKYWSFSISLSNEYSGLITFRIDWFDLLADQGTLNRLLQHHSSKASIFGTLPSLWSKCISKLLTFISVSGSCPFHQIVSSSCLRKQKTNKT